MAWLSGSRSMLLRAVKGTEWAQVLDYVSPSFFDVVPVSGLLAQGRELLGNASGPFDEVRETVTEHLAKRDVTVSLVAPDAAGEFGIEEQSLDELAARDVGQRALEVYFAQLFAGDLTILDLSAARWAPRDEKRTRPTWTPRPMYVRWDPEFLDGVRDLYRGFYSGDDAAYRRGVERLDLGEAGDVLRKHFGQDDQSAVEFRMEVFHSTFHEAFVRCREAGVKLHRNFLVLGLYLACLYDLLETLELPFDVRSAFERGAEGA